MSATDSTNWFWSDWLGDQAVRRLTLAERGLWIDLLALAAAAAPTGYICDDKGRPLTLEEIARVTNAGSPDEVAKLIAGILDKGAASRDRTGRLFNRRMVRDADLKTKRSKAGRKGAEQTNSMWLSLRDKSYLTQHLPQQVPRQNGMYHSIPLRKTSSSRIAARASPASGIGDQPSGGSLATAPCGGALREPPIAEASGPSTATRADLEAIFAKRRQG